MIVRNFYKFSSSNKRIPYISLIFFFRTNPNISGLAHIAVEIVFTASPEWPLSKGSFGLGEQGETNPKPKKTNPERKNTYK